MSAPARPARRTRGARALAYGAAVALALQACSSSDAPAEVDLDAGPLARPADAAVVPPTEAGADVGTAPAEGGPRDAAEGGPRDAADAPQLLRVAHDRELRAAWVASVYNLDWPSRVGLPEAEAKRELGALLDALVAAGANALNFQVRPESDALYPSSLEPWSRFLTGTQGQDPGWDPLAFALSEAHARGLELHAWLNPFRAAANASIPLAPNHVAARYPEHARLYGTVVTMDPGEPVVRDHVVAVVRDLVARYDVDGVVFDDYFYPYPIAGTPFPDDASYSAYLASGGALSRSDFRRANVNEVVHEVSAAIASLRPTTRFGVSPFGIYRPGSPPGVVGLDAYEALSADSLAWLARGDLDYLGPQLYWPTTSTGQPFAALASFWADQTSARGRWLVPSLDATKAGTAGWDRAA